MKVVAVNRKLTKKLSNRKNIKRYFGLLANKIEIRITEFHNADNLRQIPHTPPPRCHELEPHKNCKFAVNLSGNYRIVFEGYAKKNNGNYYLSSNKKKITAIQIISIEDYH